MVPAALAKDVAGPESTDAYSSRGTVEARALTEKCFLGRRRDPFAMEEVVLVMPNGAESSIAGKYK
jgi:hypothetical protein